MEKEFADIKRPKDGGKGLDGVVEKGSSTLTHLLKFCIKNKLASNTRFGQDKRICKSHSKLSILILKKKT